MNTKPTGRSIYELWKCFDRARTLAAPAATRLILVPRVSFQPHPEIYGQRGLHPDPQRFHQRQDFRQHDPLRKRSLSPAAQLEDFATTHRDAITSPHITTRKYTNTAASVMALPSPTTSASGIATAQSQNLSPTSARTRQASVTSEIPSVYPPSSEYRSTLPSFQWTLAHVLAWLTAKEFDQDVRKAFTENDITGDEADKTTGGDRGIETRGRKTEREGEENGSGSDTKAPASRFLGRAVRSSAGWSSSRPGTHGAKQPEDESRLRVRHDDRNRPTSLVFSLSDGALAIKQLCNPNWDRGNSRNSDKSERSVLSEGEAPRKPDIEKSKQFFDNRTLTTTKTDPSESGSTTISSCPPSLSFKREEWNDKERVASGDKDRLGAAGAGSTPKKEKDDGSSGCSRGKRSIDGLRLGRIA
ncbi:hypothetical protein FRC09_008146 [Ceratobasidium sp. 395]|nr:hypothetical protein FRC09_008146 [Ceratobasidium sp. 395]